jgi:hypothetical protein
MMMWEKQWVGCKHPTHDSTQVEEGVVATYQVAVVFEKLDDVEIWEAGLTMVMTNDKRVSRVTK